MAIQLAELVLSELESLFQTNLSTELGAIDTARSGDSLVTPVPANANYYKRPKAEITGAEAHLELFEGPLEFDTVRFYEGAADAKAQYIIPVTVRVTQINRSNYTADEMMTFMRRTQTGLFNVVSKNITPWAGSAQVISITIESINPYWEIDGEDEEKVIKVRSSMELLVQMEENQ